MPHQNYKTVGVAAGGEFLPNDKNFSKFFSRLKYRAGFNYTHTNININNNSINEFGINFGIGNTIVNYNRKRRGYVTKVLVYAF